MQDEIHALTMEFCWPPVCLCRLQHHHEKHQWVFLCHLVPLFGIKQIYSEQLWMRYHKQPDKKLAVKVTRLVTNKTIGSKPFIGRDMLLQPDKQVKYMYWYERAHKPLPARVIFSWLLTVLHRTLLPQGSQFCDFFQVEF